MDGPNFEGTKRLLTDISDAFYLSTSTTLSDVTLSSSEGKTIDTNRTLLAIRSPVFHKLLFSNFKEASQKVVRIELEHRVLSHLVEYLITGTVKSFENKAEKCVQDVLQLAHAADYFDCNSLFNDCLFLLGSVIFNCPNSVCPIAESILPMSRTHYNKGRRDRFLESLICSMAGSPTECFSVPSSVVWNDSGSARDMLQYYVAILGFDTFHELLSGYKEREDKYCTKRRLDQEYLVLVIYYWAFLKPFKSRIDLEADSSFSYTDYEKRHTNLLNGRLKVMENSTLDDVPIDRTRIKQASSLMNFVGGKQLRFEFIKRVLEPMNIATVGKLAEIYRAKAICSSTSVCGRQTQHFTVSIHGGESIQSSPHVAPRRGRSKKKRRTTTF